MPMGKDVHAHRDILLIQVSERGGSDRVTVCGLWGSDPQAYLLRCDKNA